MTPQDALASALHDGMDHEKYPEKALCPLVDPKYADQVLAALPAGWRLTDEPEVTEQRLREATELLDEAMRNRLGWHERVDAFLRSSEEGTP